MYKREKGAFNKLKEQIEYNKNLNYENLKVTLALKTPFVADALVLPDAVLTYLSCMQLWGHDFNLLSGTFLHQMSEKGIPIPLKRTYFKDDWFWKCSVLIWQGCESVFSWKKRFDEEYSDYLDFGKNKQFVRTGMGHYKNYNIPMIINSASKVFFYCVGNKPEIEKLLGTLSHIGKKTSQGFGEVKDFCIEKISEDLSCFQKIDNKIYPMRPMPIDFFIDSVKNENYNSGKIKEIPINPPYWDTKKKKICIVP